MGDTAGFLDLSFWFLASEVYHQIFSKAVLWSCARNLHVSLDALKKYPQFLVRKASADVVAAGWLVLGGWGSS